MSGYDVARALRNMSFGRSLRIIAVSGYAQESDRARSREAGFNLHLVKPLDFSSIELIIGNPAA
jgi:CheY-like chemotaxis protein